MNGEKIYEYDVTLTGMTDFGITMESILSGETPVPPQGARINVSFEGGGTGRLAGKVSGFDYLSIRADGRMNLNIQGVIETTDGHRIALAASGVSTPRSAEPIADIWENVTLTTASKKYAWVNARQVWAVGTVNLAEHKAHIEGFMQ